MPYDPFGRGRHPVGVRTARVAGPVPDRTLLAEIWYPATTAVAGRDLAPGTRDTYELLPGMPRACQDAVRDAAPADGAWPLVAFSHGFGGHRRQSTFLCTHLASHGYVVAAVDHAGNTMPDLLRQAMAVRAGGPSPDVGALLADFIRLRPEDVRVLVDDVLCGEAGGLAARIDPARVGMSGHSFGGWTALTATARDERIRATLALAPAGGDIPGLTTPLAATVDLEWRREVPTLFIVADEDCVLPIASMHELHARTPDPKRMVVIERSDHMHFCDRAAEVHELFRVMPIPGPLAEAARRARPFAELCPADEAYDVVRGLALAHFDAVLKDDPAAQAFGAHEAPRRLDERGLRARVIAADA